MKSLQEDLKRKAEAYCTVLYSIQNIDINANENTFKKISILSFSNFSKIKFIEQLCLLYLYNFYRR